MGIAFHPKELSAKGVPEVEGLCQGPSRQPKSALAGPFANVSLRPPNSSDSKNLLDFKSLPIFLLYYRIRLAIK